MNINTLPMVNRCECDYDFKFHFKFQISFMLLFWSIALPLYMYTLLLNYNYIVFVSEVKWGKENTAWSESGWLNSTFSHVTHHVFLFLYHVWLASWGSDDERSLWGVCDWDHLFTARGLIRWYKKEHRPNISKSGVDVKNRSNLTTKTWWSRKLKNTKHKLRDLRRSIQKTGT